MDNEINNRLVFENGTVLGALVDSTQLSEVLIDRNCRSSQPNLNQHQDDDDDNEHELEEHAAESTALLESRHHAHIEARTETTDTEAVEQSEDFEHYMLNRTTSDSNILESSIYSELQFTPSAGTAATAAAGVAMDLHNTSTCSRASSHQAGGVGSGSGSGGGGSNGSGSGGAGGGGSTKRTRRKHKTKTKCNVATATQRGSTPVVHPLTTTNFPPQYTAIFLDPHHHHHLSGAAANAMGQIASAAAASPFLNAPVTDASTYLQQQYHHYYQQRPLMSGLSHHHHHSLLDPTITLNTDGTAGATPMVPASNIGATTSGITPPLRISFRKWFSRPSLPFVIGILALGGVACTLGGIVLGSTGLIEHSTQYLSAALLMIGIGVSLLVISGAIWRLSLPDDADECPCYRHMETCRNCNSPYCNNRLLAGSYLYPEFQHRPPPPSYLTSLNECAAMGLLFHPAAQTQQAAMYSMRMNTPPPVYRSTNSLSVFMPGGNTNNSGNISTTAGTTTGMVPVMPGTDPAALLEHAPAQLQPFAKEFNYLELD